MRASVSRGLHRMPRLRLRRGDRLRGNVRCGSGRRDGGKRGNRRRSLTTLRGRRTQRRRRDMHDMHGGRIANAHIGAALRSHVQIERPGRMRNRQPNRQHPAAIDLEILGKRLVIEHDPRRQLRRTERRAALRGGERETLAIQVIAGRHQEVQHDLPWCLFATELERCRGIEQCVVGVRGQRHDADPYQTKQPQYKLTKLTKAREPARRARHDAARHRKYAEFPRRPIARMPRRQRPATRRFPAFRTGDARE